MGYFNFDPDMANDGKIEMSYGIHKHVKLTSISHEVNEKYGAEYINYTFVNPKNEYYTFQQRVNSSKTDFVANIIVHIATKAINLTKRCKEIESVLKLDFLEVVNGVPIYKIVNDFKSFRGNIIFGILNKANNPEQIAFLLDKARENGPKECAIKLSLGYYNDKVRVGFNQINLPFIDDDPEGKNLRWSDAKDIERPNKKSGEANGEVLAAVSSPAEAKVSDDDLPF